MIKRIVLNNGLVAILERRPILPAYSLMVKVHFGSIHEEKEHRGALHFFEHMAFRGTKKRDTYEIDSIIEMRGGDNTAYTSEEETAYIIEGHSKYIPLGLSLDLISDSIFNSIIKEEDVEKEKGVITQELKRDHDIVTETADSLNHLYDFFKYHLYDKNPVRMPVGGTVDAVSNMTREILLDYHKKYYHPNNMTLLLVGDFNEGKAIDLIKKNFGEHPKKEVLQLKFPEEQNREKKIVEFRRDIEQANLTLGFKLPSKIKLQDYLTFKIFDNILCGGYSSRLTIALRKKRGLIYRLRSSIEFAKTFCYYGISTGTEKKDIDFVEEIIIEEMKKLKKNPPSKDELEQYKKRFIAAHEVALMQNGERAEEFFFWEDVTNDIENFYKFGSLVKKITLDDFVKIADKYVETKKYTCAEILPAD